MAGRREMTDTDKDCKVFKRTAVETKKINVIPTNMRGGTRL